MKIGFVGLGKLGLPCAVAAASKGHDVMGYDIVPDRMSRSPHVHREAGPDGSGSFDVFLERSNLRFGSLKQIVSHSEIIFVVVQTPHKPKYEGVTRLPKSRTNFDYRYLVRSIEEISANVNRETVVAIVSTVLPGTVRHFIKPAASPLLRLCYNPAFTAMGTTMYDFLNPEFVLVGVDDPVFAAKVETFYASVTEAPVLRMSIDSAEVTKVAYNTFISMKIAFANTIMELCHKTPGANVDDVTRALKTAHKRIVSPRYLEGGMGDGGACHPRDNIAMSCLARELPLSHDIFENMMEARFKQTEWLVDLMCVHDLPKAIIGYSFKSGSDITIGSPALLLRSILEERGFRPFLYDPYVERAQRDLSNLPPHVFVIGAKHEDFKSLQFPKGSVVIDPWRYLAPQDGILVVPVGVGPAGIT
jgi:UDPglucose 6-dehydrogenase